nr:MAG TPA_asm: hypothetical protein [Caudoviricetes sp.]
MSKAVMLSIRPKWCEKIASGEKTVEVRKTRPKMNTPFKCYIYCTLPKYPHEDFIATNYPRPQFYGGGKVVGEFTCDRIDWITHIGHTGIPNLVETRICNAATMRTSPVGGLLNAACLTPKMLNDYLAGGDGYGWHISDLRIYDAPRELTEFRRSCPNDLYCEACAMYSNNNNGICNNGALPLRRPPQSWCYVEEDT